MNPSVFDFEGGRVLHPLVPLLGVCPTQSPLLVLHSRRNGYLSVIEMGNSPRHPKWLQISRVNRLLEEGKLRRVEFRIPERTLRPISSLSPGQLNNFNERVHIMTPLIESDDSTLLEYPDTFSDVCARYALQQGINRKYVEKLACLWLTSGKVLTGLVNNHDKCGGKGKRRNFSLIVGGPKQKDGVLYDSEAASPYTLEQRLFLIELSVKLWRRNHHRMTTNEFWLHMRKKCEKLGLPLPSFAQVQNFLQDHLKKLRGKDTTGLIHKRYAGITYASQRSEADSTQLQAFTKTQIDENVRLKNPTFYKMVDARWNYVGALLTTYEAPSNSIFADLLFRALIGMADTCRDLGLPYDENDFPPIHPGHHLAVDNQELTSSKLNRALLVHCDWKVGLAIVAKGADKGTVESGIGKDKQVLRRKWDDFFDKNSLGKALDVARRAAKGDLRNLLRSLIEVAYEHNHKELPVSRVPKAFLDTGRPANRLELYKWDLERHRELIKPTPPASDLPWLLLPTDYYAVHAGVGIYIEERYYSSQELVEAGLLRRHAKGDAPQVEVARHMGTVDFVYWVRGPNDLVKCSLHSNMHGALAGMTVPEANEHLASQPSSRKRERHRLMMAAATDSTPQTRQERKKLNTAAVKTKITKDLKHTKAVRKLQIAKDARNRAEERFGPMQERRKPAEVLNEFDYLHTRQVEELLNLRKENLPRS